MIKIIDVVQDIIRSDEEVMTAAVRGYLNYTSYAKLIKREVEQKSKKKVTIASLVVSISRICKEIEVAHPLIQEIKINNIITKSPLVELVYEKNNNNLNSIIEIYQTLQIDQAEFFTLTLSESEITIICSNRIAEYIEKTMKGKNVAPVMKSVGLASISIVIDKKYYDMPNITYTLLRRIAGKHIPLAETITTHTEIIFVFEQRHLAQMVSLFV